MEMRGKALTIITALILSGALISCSQQEQMADKKKADSNIEKMSVGKIVEIPVRVKNISQETWNAETWTAGKVGNPVNLAYHWLDSTGKMIVLDGIRTPLPNDLAPGSSVNLQARIQAPDQPGSYTLQFTMVQEQVAWFENKGAKTLTMPVTVTE
jgi:hypothetical protein